MRKSMWAALLAVASIGLGFAPAASASILDQVKERGFVNCGSNPGLAGFAEADERGWWSGFDISFCRGIAAAIFDDPNKAKFVPLTAKSRFGAVQSGEIDVLIRNTSWTMARATKLGLNMGPVNYHDGQGFMVRASSGWKSVKELNDSSICVQHGTTTEENLADFFKAHKLQYKPLIYSSAAEAINAYQSGRCGAVTADTSALYAERLRMKNSEENVILPEIISKEPLAPAVRAGDEQWFRLVQWSFNAIINAEELGITKNNIDEMKKSNDPDVRYFLGLEGNLGEDIGLPAEWAARIIRHVGNYGEIFAQNLGESSPLKIERGLNRQWNQGGILYAPPIR